MGKYSSQAANCNSEIDVAIRILEDILDSQATTRGKLNQSEDVVASCSKTSLDNIESKLSSAISSLYILKDNISSKARELDEDLEREERRRQEQAANNND